MTLKMAELRARVRALLEAGLSPEQVAKMFSISYEVFLGEMQDPSR